MALVSYNKSNLNLDCTICFDTDADIDHNDFHPVHKKCMLEWMAIHPSCPMCRAPVDITSFFWSDRFVLEMIHIRNDATVAGEKVTAVVKRIVLMIMLNAHWMVLPGIIGAVGVIGASAGMLRRFGDEQLNGVYILGVGTVAGAVSGAVAEVIDRSVEIGAIDNSRAVSGAIQGGIVAGGMLLGGMVAYGSGLGTEVMVATLVGGIPPFALAIKSSLLPAIIAGGIVAGGVLGIGSEALGELAGGVVAGGSILTGVVLGSSLGRHQIELLVPGMVVAIATGWGTLAVGLISKTVSKAAEGALAGVAATIGRSLVAVGVGIETTVGTAIVLTGAALIGGPVIKNFIARRLS